MQRLNQLYGNLLSALALVGAFLLFAMMLMICADVALRAMRMTGVPWASEMSEYILYGSTFLAAPWLLRQGRHVRLDLVLRGLPPTLGWRAEWLVDIIGVTICATLTWAGWRILWASKENGNIVIKTIAFTEWWLLIPIPLTFLLLSIEFVFRMFRLANGPRQLRDEATSAA
jgi:TRAP-type transport system small permease protein